ncbi:MAG TPA: HD domain-containing protein [archaeon]|nr:HD domain-containing protein [archaeon]
MKDVAKFFFELGTLKRTARAGWSVVGVPNPEVIASHIFRASVVGYTLAEMEKCDKDKVMRMLLFHDIPEARIGDFHKIASSYIEKDEGEIKAAREQSKLMPLGMQKEYTDLIEEFNDCKTKEAVVARDADYLEAAITAKEYLVNGYVHAQEFLDRIRTVLKTESAKKVLAEIEKSDGFWWDGLKKNI